MGHIDGTKSLSNPMPKHSHILKSDGRYYYQKRILADLVRAGCDGKATILKRSLKTGDLATASRLAKTMALEVDSESDSKRRAIVLEDPFAKVANSGEAPAKRRLSDMLDIERRDFIIRQIHRQRKAGSCRALFRVGRGNSRNETGNCAPADWKRAVDLAPDTDAHSKFFLAGVLNHSATLFKEGESVYVEDSSLLGERIKVRRKGEMVSYLTQREAIMK